MEQVKDKNKEALLNEYKGTLFEFLVAKSIAASFAQEAVFLTSLHSDLFSLLSQQEDYLRNYFPELVHSIPKLAKTTSEAIIKDLELKSLKTIKLMGRNRAEMLERDGDETDILITDDENNVFQISLKLSKSGSFTNTKSAGVKSLFKKYFTYLDPNIQNEFTRFYEQEFVIMASKMFEIEGLEYKKHFEGWEDSSLPVLPGELGGELKDCLKEFYALVNKKLYEFIQKAYELDATLFYQSLRSLMGFSDENIIQVTTYYKKVDDTYTYVKTDIHRLEESSKKIEIKYNKSNIEVHFSNAIVQLRVKPMNKFIHSSYKINCAVKFS